MENNLLESIIVDNTMNNDFLILELCKVLKLDDVNLNLVTIKNIVSSSYDTLTVANKKTLLKLVESLPNQINDYIQQIFADGKLDMNDLLPLSSLIRYLVENMNKLKEIKNVDNEVVVLLIKLIVVLIIQKYGDINDYLQIINLSFECLSLVIKGYEIKKSIFCCC
jgi:hypothetical protein